MERVGRGNGTGKTVVGVFLDCVSCGTVEEIHVFPERKLPTRVYWECLDCQKHDNRSGKGEPRRIDGILPGGSENPPE